MDVKERLPPIRKLLVIVLVLSVVLSVGAIAITNSATVEGTIPLNAADGPEVVLQTPTSTQTQLDLTNVFPDNSTVDVTHENANGTFSGSAGTSLTVATADLEGTNTVITNIDASAGTVTIDPADKSQVSVSGGINSITYSEAFVDDSTTDFTYSASSTATVTYGTTSASDEQVIAVASDGTILDSADATLDTGTVQFDSLPGGTYDVSLQTATAPTFSGASPSSNTTVSDSPVNLTIDVTDDDFSDSKGDSVDVTFYDASDDSPIATDVITSDGTASVSWDGVVGGSNSWYAVATDDYGNEVTSSTFTFLAPAELEVRNETAPSQLITDSDVTIEFYPQGMDSSNVITRPVTNGTVDMTGLDATTEFIAVANADGYTNRRIYISSLVETQEIYLLNETSESVDVEFELEDFSGRYQQDTSVLIVEREINGEFTPIQGDFFGATGRWEATLQPDVRHRLRIKNIETGAERTLGPFTPQTSGVQTVTVEPDGAVQLTPEFEQVFAQPALGVIPAEQGAVFGVDITEGDETINSYEIEVQHMDENGTITTLDTRTGEGTALEEFKLDLRGLQGQVIANVVVNTEDGSRTVMVSREIRESYPGADGLLGGLLQIGEGIGVTEESGASGISSMASFFLSVVITAAVAGKTRASADLAGLTALGSLTGFAVIGWLSMQVLFAVAVAFAAALVLRRGI